MLRSQLVEDVGGVEAGVVAQLPGDDLQGLGVRSDQQLLFPGDSPGVIPQVLGQLHLYGPSACDNGVVLERHDMRHVYLELPIFICSLPALAVCGCNARKSN